MGTEKKKITATLHALLAAVFYGTMAYQLAGEDVQAAPKARQGAAGALLTLPDAELIAEQTVTERRGGQACTAVVRTYRLENGAQAEAITARPAAYIERLSEEGYAPQLITGFLLAEMEAVYAVRGEAALLCARADDAVYMIAGPADEQAMYALGAAARLE